MNRYLKRALDDIKSNKFLNAVTVVTIALSIFVVGASMLFFENAGSIIKEWNSNGRIMAYLKDEFTVEMLPDINKRIKGLDKTQQVFFISKDVALENLKNDINVDSVFFTTLKGNPLPHSLDIRMDSVAHFSDVQEFARKVKNLPLVADVEYGQQWLDKFLSIYRLFKFAGYTMSGLFFLIALFITANTVRLAFYSRKEEVDIMHLVGATDRFIKSPFYLEGLLQGTAGGILGLVLLAAAYAVLSPGVNETVSSYMFVDLRFLSFKNILVIIAGSTFLGFFGCYISLKQLLR